MGRLSAAVSRTDALFGVERGQVVEQRLVPGNRGVLEIDLGDLEQGKITLAFLGRADLSGNRVAGAQGETANLGGRYIDIIRTREIVGIGRPQETETVGKDLQHPLAEDGPVFFGCRIQDGENEILLAHACSAFELQLLGDARQVGDFLLF